MTDLDGTGKKAGQSDTASWLDRFTELVDSGDYAEAERQLAAAEAVTNVARELIRPRAVSPCRARLMRYPAKPRN
jgi:hypothetical protein